MEVCGGVIGSVGKGFSGIVIGSVGRIVCGGSMGSVGRIVCGGSIGSVETDVFGSVIGGSVVVGKVVIGTDCVFVLGVLVSGFGSPLGENTDIRITDTAQRSATINSKNILFCSIILKNLFIFHIPLINNTK